MKRLVIDLLGFTQGKSYGFQEYICNLLNYFVNNRKDICVDDIVVVCQKSQEAFLSAFTKQCFSIFSMRYYTAMGKLLYARLFPIALHLSSQDIVLFPGNTAPLGRKKYKNILVVHDLLSFHKNLCASTLKFRLFRMHKYIYIPASIKTADAVIAISSSTHEEILNKYSYAQMKVFTIYNYFNFEKFIVKKVNSANTPIAPFGLAICSSAYHKNHLTLLKGFEIFSQMDANYNLVIVCSALPEAARQYYDALNISIKRRIILKNNLSNSEMSELYLNASFFVSTSLYEGLGMPIVEALYFGLPVILSNIPIHHEVSFNMALFFQPTSHVDLANKMCMVVSNPIQYIRGVDKNRIIQRYDAENTSKQYVRLINQLIC